MSENNHIPQISPLPTFSSSQIKSYLKGTRFQYVEAIQKNDTLQMFGIQIRFPGMLYLMVTTLDKVSGFRRGHPRKRLNAESMCYSFYRTSLDAFFISSFFETILIVFLANKHVQLTIRKFRAPLDGKSVTNKLFI